MSRYRTRQKLAVALLLLLVLVLGLYGFTHASPLDLLVPALAVCFVLYLAAQPPRSIWDRLTAIPHNCYLPAAPDRAPPVS